jgi:hypothetical protein
VVEPAQTQAGHTTKTSKKVVVVASTKNSSIRIRTEKSSNISIIN